MLEDVSLDDDGRKPNSASAPKARRQPLGAVTFDLPRPLERDFSGLSVAKYTQRIQVGSPLVQGSSQPGAPQGPEAQEDIEPDAHRIVAAAEELHLADAGQPRERAARL